jgi:hypothetical protein
MKSKRRFFLAIVALGWSAWDPSATAQSVDWQSVVWRDPQVRYLLADMTATGSADFYRKYAEQERDPDSREAVRLWDAGVRVANMAEFERKWLENRFGKDGRVMRIVHRGTERTITGNEVVLTNDGEFPQGPMRLALLATALGVQADTSDPASVEAQRRFRAGCRVTNAHLFQLRDHGSLVFKNTARPADAAFVRLNSDLPYPEVNVRYFMADIALGGSIEFYRAAAERDHEMGCAEAVRRSEEGFRITNLYEFERKKVNGRTLITRKGSDEGISGTAVKLSSDLQP